MTAVSTPQDPQPDPQEATGLPDPNSAQPAPVELGDRKLDFKILAVFTGCTLLLAAVVAEFVFESEEHSAMLAMLASILLGAPIVWGAAVSLWTGRCSHDHGDACDHDHDHDHAHDHSHSKGKGSPAASAHDHSNHMEELVAIAIIAAFAAGWYIECAAVAFFMLIASLIEHRTAVGALKTIESLIRITPTKAVMLTGNGEQEVAAADLKPGDRVLVLPGDNIPGDGHVAQGVSSVNQANITGESLPVEKQPGDEVFGGTINQTGRMEIIISRAGEDSTLGKVQSLILQAAQSRTTVERELNKYARFYTPVVLMVGFTIWFVTRDMRDFISLLLIACPCALILAGPTAIVAALSAAARLGILVKSVSDLEVVRRVTAFVFDKTGTLTTGELAVTRMKPAAGVQPVELLRACLTAEQNSRHPVARAVVEVAKKAKLTAPVTEHFEEVSGRGVIADLADEQGGGKIMVGRENWLQEQGVTFEGMDMSESEGMSLLFVAKDGACLGWVGLSDTPRKQAAMAVHELEQQGVKRRVMITGDRPSPARRVAEVVGITDFQAEALPGDKLKLVEDLKAAGHTVAVVGDGVNDGPALAAGHVSIAMGAAGSDVAINSASIALMNNNLDRLPFLVDLSRQTVAVIRQNLAGTLIYIVLMLVLLGLGYMTPLVAAIGHGISSIIVVFNSARLVRCGENLEHQGMTEDEPGQQRVRHIESVAARPATA